MAGGPLQPEIVGHVTIRHVPVLIIGSGPAGYTAAIYAARAMLKPVLIAGLQQGGQLMITTDVENYPGFADIIQGPWLMEEMLKQAEHVGTEVVNDYRHRGRSRCAAVPRRRRFSGTVYTADALIIATGAQARWLGIRQRAPVQGLRRIGLRHLRRLLLPRQGCGRGRRRQFGAVEEALYLSNLAKTVTVVHRRGEFRAERILQERLFHKENVKVIWDTAVDEITGIQAKPPMPASVTGVTLRNTRTGALTEVPTDGVFVAIGHAPAVELFVGKLKQKPNGYLWTAPDSTEHRHARRLCRGRRDRRYLPAGGDGGRAGLHGGAGSRKIPGRAWKCTAKRRNNGRAEERGEVRWRWTGTSCACSTPRPRPARSPMPPKRCGCRNRPISRQVSALEQELAVSLFHRHARGLILTEQGEMLFRTAHDVLMQLEAIKTRLTEAKDRPSGILRVTTTVGLGAGWLTERVPEFLELYPEVNLQLILANEELDLTMRQADCAIRLRAAAAAGSDPAPAVHRALPPLCLADLHFQIRQAGLDGRAQEPPHRHLR